MKSYTANALNQYTAIANPDAVGLRGSATNTATVKVNGNAALSDNIASDTVPWHFALQADNADGPDYTFASIMAVVNPPGTNTPDIVESTSGSVYAPPQQEALAYDDDGNILSDGRWHYTWNGENRLVCAEEQVCPTNRTLRKVEYGYDHQGRMVWKAVSHRATEAQSWEAEKSIAYLWDSFNIIAETTVAGSATNDTYNIWGLDLDGALQGAGGVGGLLAIVKDSSTYVPTYDGNGNIMEYVAEDGTIVAHREYDPFGGTVVATGDANDFTHWFSTKPWCTVTGLSEYQYRKYSPLLGRWLSRDPIGEYGGRNLYATGYNCLVFGIDRYGMFLDRLASAAVGGIISSGISMETALLAGAPARDILIAGASSFVGGAVTGALLSPPPLATPAPAGAIGGFVSGFLSGVATEYYRMVDAGEDPKVTVRGVASVVVTTGVGCFVGGKVGQLSDQLDVPILDNFLSGWFVPFARTQTKLGINVVISGRCTLVEASMGVINTATSIAVGVANSEFDILKNHVEKRIGAMDFIDEKTELSSEINVYEINDRENYGNKH
ncbi:MAG: RHS repeat-associated core domain-containing protein [Lentisphaerae bacterium]|nr:RHS repeat-associated core domain-containing protein [Lentisphaerota bacterium]